MSASDGETWPPRSGALVLGERDRALEDVERLARVAAREVDEVLERVVGRARRRPSGRTRRRARAPRPRARAGRSSPTSSSVERLEAEHAHPRQERRVDLEVRVLGRGADQRDRAVLDVGQERVLLRLVEAVDLVDEQDACARPSSASRSCAAAITTRTSATPPMTAERVRELARRPPRRAGGRASSCRCPAGPTGAASARWPRSTDAAQRRRARRRGAPGRRTRRASAGACGRRAAAARAAVGTGLRGGRRGRRAGSAWGDGSPPRVSRPGTRPATSIRMYRTNRIANMQRDDPDDVAARRARRRRTPRRVVGQALAARYPASPWRASGRPAPCERSRVRLRASSAARSSASDLRLDLGRAGELGVA